MDSLFDWHLIATVLCETEKLCPVRRKAMGFAPNGATEIMRIILQRGKGLVNWMFVQNTFNSTFIGPFARLFKWSNSGRKFVWVYFSKTFFCKCIYAKLTLQKTSSFRTLQVNFRGDFPRIRLAGKEDGCVLGISGK